MATQSSSQLVIVNGMPSAKRLDNGRFRLEFFCDPINKNEGWYNENIDKWLPAFGSLQDAAIENGWTYPNNSDVAYTDMHLVEAGVEFIPSVGTHYVVLAYETLTGAFVQEKDEDIDFSLNGLQRVTRTLVALPETAYTNVVGTDTITVGGDTLTLGAFKIDETDAKWSLTETWLGAGTLSQSEDKVGSQLAIVIEAFGETPSTPVGYSLARTDVSDFEGISTNRYTFLKPSVLSRSIQTKSNGKLILETVEAFDETPTADTAGAVQIGNDVSNVEGIPTRRYTFAKDAGQISVDKRPESPPLAGSS